MSDDEYQKSKKLDQIKNFNKKPLLVNIEWLLDSMTEGTIVDGNLDKYRFDIGDIQSQVPGSSRGQTQ